MTHAATPALSTLEAYELWADTYAPEPHNPLMAAEQDAMVALLPDVRGRRVLDLACGTGRYSRLVATAPAALVVALDRSPAMLRRVTAGLCVQASMDRLPFTNCSFDVVISGLALGHAPDVGRWMQEVARVLAPGGTLLYSDFHPAASQRGLSRTFKDRSGRWHAVAQFCHAIEAQRHAAAAAGLTLQFVRELRAGIEFLEPFPGAQEFYERQYGTPLVLVVRACRQAT
ncbi:MAG TPA: methyltransferase domain-containing protein [Steroidobacteraceae bacterium]